MPHSCGTASVIGPCKMRASGRTRELAFRKAYDLEPDRYGYCLGTALNFLDRHAEAIPMLMEQAEKHLPDARSWFQVAVAREGVGDQVGAIEAYQRALQLDPDYDLAWFNLGGIHWNLRDFAASAFILGARRLHGFPNTWRRGSSNAICHSCSTGKGCK